METKTYSGFLNFIREQPPGKTIVHAVWGKCAVGEYVNGYSSDNGPEHSKATQWAQAELPPRVYQMIYTKRPKTYGDLLLCIMEEDTSEGG